MAHLCVARLCLRGRVESSRSTQVPEAGPVLQHWEKGCGAACASLRRRGAVAVGVTAHGKRGDKGAMVREDWAPCFIIMLSSSVNTEVCLQRFIL